MPFQKAQLIHKSKSRSEVTDAVKSYIPDGDAEKTC